MALRHSARLKKGHRPFRESWKRGLRRPRDALPDGPRQSQLNLAWARAKSQKKKPPTKHSKETLAILEDILRDPVLSVELEHYAGYKTPHEVPEDARAAVERSVLQLLGEDALQSISAAPTAHRQSPQLAVYVDRSLSQYDRNDLAVALEALGFATRVTRHGVRLAARGEPEVEVLVGLAQELLSHKRGGFCPFPVSHLTVAEDWREAVLELVLRHLALRIQDRDAQALARFKAALAGQGGEDSHSLGSKMAISMAKEMLEWSKSGVLGLWLKDAELYAGKRGKAQASHLLNAAAQQLDGEIWGLGHTQSCPLPKEETLEAAADRLLTKGIRLVHFGCYEDASRQLTEAEELLAHAERIAEVHQRLSLAATVTKFILERRRGRGDKALKLNGDCEEALDRLEQRRASARPLACWHNLPLLLRACSKSQILPNKKGELEDSEDSAWPNFEATGADDAGMLTGEQLHRQKLKRSRDFMRRLMPMTGKRFASDDLELCRVQKGFAELLC